MKGTLSEGVLPGLLRELYVGRKTGLLHFTRGEEQRSVRFRRGHIIHAKSNLKDEWLGEVLVRHGLLSEADLKRATGFVMRDKRRLGQVLQEMGIMNKNQVEDALGLHVREILFKVFTWTEGEYAFEEQTEESPEDEEITLKLSTGEMILEAVRRVQDPDVVRYALGNIDRYLGLSNDPLLRFQKITLTPVDGYVVSRIDGTLSAREVTQLIPVPVEETQRSLFGLLCTGVVEYLPVPPKPAPKAAPAGARAAAKPAPAPPAPQAARPVEAPPPPPPLAPPPPEAANPDEEAVQARRQEILEAYEGLKTRNHFEVLGIPKASSEADVKAAYFRLAKRFHPDTHHDPNLADLRDKIEAVFIRLGQAYEVLRNPKTRASYEADLAARAPRVPVPPPAAGPSEPPPPVDPTLEARLAEDSIRKAERCIAEEKYWDAIQLLEPAVPNAQGKWRQRGQLALAKAYMKNPHWVKRAEELLQKVVQEDPQSAEPYFVLGTIYKGSGLKSRALSMFRRALEIKPDHQEALAEAGALLGEGPGPAREGAGILKKLFGRS